MSILTEQELQVILGWERDRASQFLLDGSQENVDVVLPAARNKGFGKITPESLDAAVAISFRSLKYFPGHEHPVIKQELAKAAADKVQDEKNKRIKKKEFANAWGIHRGSDRTELDQDDDRQARARAEKKAAEKEAFKKTQLQAKAEFEKICDQYIVTRASGRTDHSKTEERRDLLRQIKVTKKNENVILYTEMVRLANEALRGFEREDSKITW